MKVRENVRFGRGSTPGDGPARDRINDRREEVMRERRHGSGDASHIPRELEAQLTMKHDNRNKIRKVTAYAMATLALALVAPSAYADSMAAGTTDLQGQEATVATQAQTVEVQAMHRMYNPNSGEHFYTASDAERDHLVSVGWKHEGTGWMAPTTGEPVYRVYNPNAGDHHYTTSSAERDHLVGVGWKDEGVGWMTASDAGVPVYRQYNPNAKAGAHNFTTSEAEHEHLGTVGWSKEGVAWYGARQATESVYVPEGTVHLSSTWERYNNHVPEIGPFNSFTLAQYNTVLDGVISDNSFGMTTNGSFGYTQDYDEWAKYHKSSYDTFVQLKEDLNNYNYSNTYTVAGRQYSFANTLFEAGFRYYNEPEMSLLPSGNAYRIGYRDPDGGPNLSKPSSKSYQIKIDRDFPTKAHYEDVTVWYA